MKSFLGKYSEEVLYLTGCLLIVLATALLSMIAAIYVVGVMLILTGVLVGLLNAKVKFGRSEPPGETIIKQSEDR